MVLEKTLESPLDCKEIQPIHPEGNQPWIFIGTTDAEAETPILWPPDVKNWLTGKDPDAGKDWRQEEKGMTEDEMVGWHHLLDGHKFKQAPGVGDGQGSLACCSPWGYKESDTTEQLRWTEIDPIIKFYSHLSCLFPILPSRIRPSITHMSSAKLNRIRSKKQLWSYCKGNTYGLCLLLVSILKYPQTIILRNQTS